MATSIKKECNVIMVGRTGVGKSSLGNSLLGQPDTKPFKSTQSARSITVQCKRKQCLLNNGTLLTAIDTPGLFDTSTPNKDTIIEICKCAILSAPGPDIIVFVLNIRRFTQEEIATIDILKKLFGEEAMKHVIIVFTGKDELDDADDDDDIKTVAEFIEQSPPFLIQLVRECNNRYVGIANRPRSPTHESDVNDVMKLIYKTMYENNNQVYSQGLFLQAERIIQRLIRDKTTEKPVQGRIGEKRQTTTEKPVQGQIGEKGQKTTEKTIQGQIEESEKDTTEHEREVREEIKRDIESNNEGYLSTLWKELSNTISHVFAVPETIFATGRKLFQHK